MGKTVAPEARSVTWFLGWRRLYGRHRLRIDRLASQATALASSSAISTRPSSLAKAFRGELAPQDPADEPAGVLLERIRAAPAVRRSRGAQ